MDMILFSLKNDLDIYKKELQDLNRIQESLSAGIQHFQRLNYNLITKLPVFNEFFKTTSRTIECLASRIKLNEVAFLRLSKMITNNKITEESTVDRDSSIER